MTGRIRQLDAVRGIAILVVMFHNEGKLFPALHLGTLFASGWMGVDLFFVLSGFLITGILLDAKGSTGYFRNFYARRCLRIWPLYYSLLALMFIGIPLVKPAQGHLIFERSTPWWSYPLYLQNFLVARSTNAVGPLGVTWSLAIEEQFYLVWPLLVRWSSPRKLRILAIAVIGFSPLLRWGLTHESVDLYSNVFCRLDGLMAGALLAIVVREASFTSQKHLGRVWAALAITGPLALVADHRGVDWLVYSLSAVASAAFVYLALFSRARWLQRTMAWRPLVYTGTISYGLYLLHKLPFDLLKGSYTGRFPALVFVVLLIACYAIAGLSWQVLERPILRLRRYFEVRPGPQAQATRISSYAAQPMS